MEMGLESVPHLAGNVLGEKLAQLFLSFLAQGATVGRLLALDAESGRVERAADGLGA